PEAFTSHEENWFVFSRSQRSSAPNNHHNSESKQYSTVAKYHFSEGNTRRLLEKENPLFLRAMYLKEAFLVLRESEDDETPQRAFFASEEAHREPAEGVVYFRSGIVCRFISITVKQQFFLMGRVISVPKFTKRVILKEEKPMYKRIGILLYVSLFLIAGCQQDKENALPEKGNSDQFIHVKNSDPNQKDSLSNTQLADHLANVAGDVPNVKDATAVVAGPYAVVGIDVDKDLDRSRVGTIKYSVTEALQHDPYGKTAVVVADADVMERLRGMGNKISQGHPVQGVVDELSAIVGRYMPDFPINEDQPREPDQNKD